LELKLSKNIYKLKYVDVIMVKNKLILMGLMLIAITILVACNSTEVDKETCEEGSGTWIEETEECIIEDSVINSTNSNLKEICESNSGNWLEEHKECEYVSQELCNEMNGNFDQCASSCRHIEGDVMCTMQCVPVCSFD
jgi:hypothetical protein